MILRLLWLFVMWLGLTLLYLPLWFVGLFAIAYALIFKRYYYDVHKSMYFFKDKFLKVWQTHDNGCCPSWYIANYGTLKPEWPTWTLPGWKKLGRFANKPIFGSLAGKIIFTYHRPVWMNILIWSGFRNAVGGNPVHIYNVPAKEVRIWGDSHPSATAIRHFLHTGEREWFWRVIQYKWRVGFWACYPFMRQYEKDPTDKFDVIDIQHGYKINYPNGRRDDEYINLVFSPWDSGRRRN